MIIFTYSLKGRRQSNEDQHYYLLNQSGKNKKYNKINFFGVFDGHGGKLVSAFLKDNLPKYLCNKTCGGIYKKNKTTRDFILSTFDRVQNKLVVEHPRAVSYSGSTALCAIMKKDRKTKSNILWMANVGDSRAVLCSASNKAIRLTKDHKPNDPKEKKRILSAGGTISYDGCDWRVKGNLSMSRAFGDTELSPYVISKPDVFKIMLKKSDRFIIMACDGLWDVLSDKQACDFINRLLRRKYKGDYAKKIVEHAYKLGSTDNITVIVILL